MIGYNVTTIIPLLLDGYYICIIHGHKMCVNVQGFHCLRPQEEYLIAHHFPCSLSSSRLAWPFCIRSTALHTLHWWRYVPHNGVTTYSTIAEKITACYGNNIAKLTVFLRPTFMLLTCVTHTLPRSSCVESALRIPHVSVCVFHLVKQWEGLLQFGTAALQKTVCGEFVVLTDSVEPPIYKSWTFSVSKFSKENIIPKRMRTSLQSTNKG